jgi:hypothetical protein
VAQFDPADPGLRNANTSAELTLLEPQAEACPLDVLTEVDTDDTREA